MWRLLYVIGFRCGGVNRKSLQRECQRQGMGERGRDDGASLVSYVDECAHDLHICYRLFIPFLSHAFITSNTLPEICYIHWVSPMDFLINWYPEY